MLLIIVWYFFHKYFWPRRWTQPPEISLGLGLEVLTSFNITDPGKASVTENFNWIRKLRDSRFVETNS